MDSTTLALESEAGQEHLPKGLHSLYEVCPWLDKKTIIFYAWD